MFVRPFNGLEPESFDESVYIKVLFKELYDALMF